MKLNAVFFDVDGTVAETEDFHRKAFNESFKEFGLDWYWDEAIYRELTHVGGGKERIKYYINRAWPEMLDYKNLAKYIQSIHQTKNDIYDDYMQLSKIVPRPGVLRLINDLRNNKIRIGLVSSTSEENLRNLFNKGLQIDPEEISDIIAHGGSTIHKKPSPEVYEWTLEKLKLPAGACIAIEDSPRGLEAALKANINTLITPSILTVNEDFNGAKLVVTDLGEKEKPFKKISGNDYGHDFVNFQLLQKLIS